MFQNLWLPAAETLLVVVGDSAGGKVVDHLPIAYVLKVELEINRFKKSSLVVVFKVLIF